MARRKLAPLVSSHLPEGTVDGRSAARQRRKGEVYDAAIALFIERGFEDTTMDDIAERAGVARTSVFNYFPRKTDILVEWGARRRHRALAAAHSDHLESMTARDVLQRYMAELAELSTRTREETIVMMGASLRALNLFTAPPLADDLRAVLETMRANHQLPEDADCGLAAILLTVGYFAALSSWIDVDPAPFDLGTQLVKGVDLMLHGLLGPDATRSARRR